MKFGRNSLLKFYTEQVFMFNSTLDGVKWTNRQGVIADPQRTTKSTKSSIKIIKITLAKHENKNVEEVIIIDWAKKTYRWNFLVAIIYL